MIIFIIAIIMLIIIILIIFIIAVIMIMIKTMDEQVHTILSPGDHLGLVIRGGSEYGVSR